MRIVRDLSEIHIELQRLLAMKKTFNHVITCAASTGCTFNSIKKIKSCCNFYVYMFTKCLTYNRWRHWSCFWIIAMPKLRMYDLFSDFVDCVHFCHYKPHYRFSRNTIIHIPPPHLSTSTYHGHFTLSQFLLGPSNRGQTFPVHRVKQKQEFISNLY